MSTLFIGLVAGAVGTGYFVLTRLALPRAAILVPLAMTSAGCALTASARVRRQGPWVVAGAMLVTYVVLLVSVVPAVEQQKVVAEMARTAARLAGPDDRIASYRLNRWAPSFRFYVDRQTTFLDEPDAAAAFFAASPAFVAVMLRQGYDELVARGAPLKIVAERDGLWMTTGRVLWRGFSPDARFVVVARAK